MHADSRDDDSMTNACELTDDDIHVILNWKI